MLQFDGVLFMVRPIREPVTVTHCCVKRRTHRSTSIAGVPFLIRANMSTPHKDDIALLAVIVGFRHQFCSQNWSSLCLYVGIFTLTSLCREDDCILILSF